MGSVLQWVAVVAEFIGLSLIAIELYLPSASEQLKAIFERTKPDFLSRPETRSEKYRIARWVGLYILIWIVVVAVLSISDPSMGLIANVAFTVLTILLLSLIGIGRILVRLGVVLGRGNSVGGVGLVMALIGFSLEVSQLVVA